MKELRKPLIKTLIAVWALSGDSLSLLLSGYASDVPLLKYVFTVLEHMGANSMLYLFAFLAVGSSFYLVRDRQKNAWVTGLSAFFAVCTVFGISYSQTGSWDCVFLFGTQFLLAVFVGTGYFFLYKNFILLLQFILSVNGEWAKPYEPESAGRWGRLIFGRNAFWGAFGFLMVCSLPWLAAFAPGTLQWDAHAQLWMAMGVTVQTSYHPVFISDYMAGCVRLGRLLFHSDSAGMFFYTFPQLVAQNLVFGYAVQVMQKKRCPVALQWAALLFWGIFPYFQIWGFTMVKDTPYYIGFVLWMAVLADVLLTDERTARTGGVSKRHYLLLAVAVGLMALSRNDGRYVVFIGLIVLIIAYRRCLKLFATGALVCLCLLIIEEGIFMPLHGIGKGPAGEMYSVPLQQTARYLRDHMDEVTPQEYETLQAGFDIELTEVAGKYRAEISDPVKTHFVKNPDNTYLKEYGRVWLAQFRKHPDTYAQAWLNLIYGYFYPDLPNQGDYLTVTYLGNSDHWQDESLDFAFWIKNGTLRDLLRHVIYTVEKMPVLSLFYGCGIYTYMLLGMAACLIARGRRSACGVLAPAFAVLLICLASPVNGYLRYMMPVMAAMPVLIAWCLQSATLKSGTEPDAGMDEE